MTSGHHPKQAIEAARYVERAKFALDHALPRGTNFVVLIEGPGFNTYGSSDLPKSQVIASLEGLLHELRRDVLHGG